jgi:hypothetical protein
MAASNAVLTISPMLDFERQTSNVEPTQNSKPVCTLVCLVFLVWFRTLIEQPNS